MARRNLCPNPMRRRSVFSYSACQRCSGHVCPSRLSDQLLLLVVVTTVDTTNELMTTSSPRHPTVDISLEAPECITAWDNGRFVVNAVYPNCRNKLLDAIKARYCSWFCLGHKGSRRVEGSNETKRKKKRKMRWHKHSPYQSGFRASYYSPTLLGWIVTFLNRLPPSLPATVLKHKNIPSGDTVKVAFISRVYAYTTLSVGREYTKTKTPTELVLILLVVVVPDTWDNGTKAREHGRFR